MSYQLDGDALCVCGHRREAHRYDTADNQVECTACGKCSEFLWADHTEFGFHALHGYYFARLANGDVRISRRQTEIHAEHGRTLIVVPQNIWTTVVSLMQSEPARPTTEGPDSQ